MGDQEHQYKSVALFCGVILTLYGLLLLISWHFGFSEFLKLPPSTEVFPYLASLNLLLFGLGLLSIYTSSNTFIPNMFGWAIFILSGLNLLDEITGSQFLISPFSLNQPFKMTYASSIGYMWASIALSFWKPYSRSSYKDNVPFLFSLVLVVGGVCIILSYLAKLHAIFTSIDAANFNFYGVIAIMFFAFGMMASSYYFKVTTLMSRLMRLPVLITVGFVVFAVLLATAFSVEGEESIKKLLRSKNQSLLSVASNHDFAAFETSAKQSLGDEYSLTLYRGGRVVLQLNGDIKKEEGGLQIKGAVELNDNKYTYLLYPSKKLVALFINRTITHLILVTGFIIAVAFGSLYRMWQQTGYQLEINQKLQSDLEKTISLKKHILESVAIGTWKLDLQANELIGDALFNKLFGCEGEKYCDTYQNFIEMIDSKHHEYLERSKNISLQNKAPYEVTFSLSWKDGSTHYILSKGQPFYQKNGNPSHIEGIAWDITDIKRAQLFLEFSEAVAKLLAERKGLSETNADFIKILNHYFGWEVLVLRLLDLGESKLKCVDVAAIPGSNITTFEKVARDAQVIKGFLPAGKAWSARSAFWEADIGGGLSAANQESKEFKGVLALPIFEESHFLGVLELYKRETLTKELDENLLDLMNSTCLGLGQYIKKREAEELQAELAVIVANFNEGMYSLTTDGIVKSWNHGAEEIFGWSASEVVGKHVKKLYITELESNFNLFFRKAIHSNVSENVEIEALSKNGRRLWVSKKMSVIRGNSDEVQGCCVIVEDITKKRELEKAKRKFISMISHELKTPLSSIHSIVSLLRVDTSESKKVRELMDVVYQNSVKLTYLVGNILTIEESDLGGLHFNYEILPVKDVVTEAIQNAEVLAEKKSIRINKEFKDFDSVLVRVERKRMVGVVFALLSNAIKFSHEGSAVYVSLNQKNDNIRITVRDVGLGIAEGVKEKVFERFFQAGLNLSHESQGAGLGLFVSKKVIEGMGGHIGFESKLNEGSTFYIDLPIQSLTPGCGLNIQPTMKYV